MIVIIIVVITVVVLLSLIIKRRSAPFPHLFIKPSSRIRIISITTFTITLTQSFDEAASVFLSADEDHGKFLSQRIPLHDMLRHYSFECYFVTLISMICAEIRMRKDQNHIVPKIWLLLLLLLLLRRCFY
ncbi:hypothetical protein BCR42DRAFT_71996 [Absidia repens]|uniref:Uncharacterized protein n=1 Tax=Absidia repens TaxID=90262 RepID=A0A1X2IB36_9FUNG|nr:hypothetical protein BCR42DRAFT_71996 [Absidia repens]